MNEDIKTMPIRRCGRSGLCLSAIGLGLGRFGPPADAPITADDEDNAFRLLDRALELGVTHWDTASGYQGGNSEALVGRWFTARGNDVRDKIILSTKWAGPLGGGRGMIRKAVEGCLRRLHTDYIDMFMLHNPMWENGQYIVPIEETWGALDELASQGKIHYMGISNAHTINVRDANDALTRVGKDVSRRLAAVENVYNLIRRNQVGRGLWTDWIRGGTEDAFLSDLKNQGIGLIPFWPLADGALGGRYRKDNIAITRHQAKSDTFRAEYLEGPTFETIEKLGCFADRKGIPLSQLAIAWLLTKPIVASVIVGASSIEHLEGNAAAAFVALSPEEVAEIEQIATGVENVDDFCRRFFGSGK